MSDATPAPVDPPPRRRSLVLRWLGLAPTLASLAAVLALAAAWARSTRVEEAFRLARDGAAYDPVAGSVKTHAFRVEAESGRGVAGLTLRYDRWSKTGLPPAFFNWIRGLQTDSGWRFARTDRTGSDRLFDRTREAVGALRTLYWEHERRDRPNDLLGGLRTWEHWRLVSPYWLLMLPFAVPPVWWLWCPPGRSWPRLTTRRLAAAVAGLALVLTGLAAFGRVTAADRAMAVIAEYGGTWSYGPDPGGSGRPVVTGVDLANYLHSREFNDAEAPRLRAALAAFPALRSLKIGSPNVTGAGLALLEDHPDLEHVWLAGSGADDAALAHVRGHARLRELYLDQTRVTDAGLVQIGDLPALEALWLDDLPVSDAGLMHLARLPRLRTLFLQSSGPKSRVTEAGVRRLLASIPTLERVVMPDGQSLKRAR